MCLGPCRRPIHFFEIKTKNFHQKWSVHFYFRIWWICRNANLDKSDEVKNWPKAWSTESPIWRYNTVTLRKCLTIHSMARANLNKSVWLVTNTIQSKYIPRRPKISINWNPTFQTFFSQILVLNFFLLV